MSADKSHDTLLQRIADALERIAPKAHPPVDFEAATPSSGTPKASGLSR